MAKVKKATDEFFIIINFKNFMQIVSFCKDVKHEIKI